MSSTPSRNNNSLFEADIYPLLKDDRYNDEASEPRRSPQLMQQLNKTLFALAASIGVNIVLAIVLFTQSTSVSREALWNPLGHLKYDVKVFASGFSSEKTPFQGPPGEQTEKAWKDSYVEAFVLTRDEASQLPNKTVSLTADPESGYVTSFSVMHYLHCLHMVRQVTDFLYYPDHHNVTINHNHLTHGLEEWPQFRKFGMWNQDHISHCIDNVRQALMCKPDLGPVVWQWAPDKKRVQVLAQTAHSCANYDKVLSFAKAREVEGEKFTLDKLTHREGVGQCGFFDGDC